MINPNLLPPAELDGFTIEQASAIARRAIAAVEHPTTPMEAELASWLPLMKRDAQEAGLLPDADHEPLVRTS